MINNSEQWKSSGNCKECRRKEYCTKKCSAWKKRQDEIIHNIVASIFTTTVDGKYGKLR